MRREPTTVEELREAAKALTAPMCDLFDAHGAAPIVVSLACMTTAIVVMRSSAIPRENARIMIDSVMRDIYGR